MTFTRELMYSLSKVDEGYARRMLLHTALAREPSAVVGIPSPSQAEGSSFDANVIMILAVLLCALICALGLNSVLRCALRCSNRTGSGEGGGGGGAAGCSGRRGVKKKALRTLPTFTYSEGLRLPGAVAECAICLSEYAAGERVRVLPGCNHGFHVKCIDRWLVAHPSCPTCRQCLSTSSMCPKAYRCPAGTSMPMPPPPPPSIINPLDPEGLLIDYRVRYQSSV